ncbi:MAG: HD domain-containing protein [Tenuifilaceae bacterium]|jgi:HD superfamily phosphodiesterase|nr:HD domain-containing protein [Tenuifilaceae bacterium]
MVQTLDRIWRAEALWKSSLIGYLQHIYRNTHLPSHDLNHHLRVWEYSKQLLLEMDKVGGLCYDFTVEQVLVACLFHDTGLIYDRGERHGYQSRLICEQFFNENPYLTIDGFDMVLHAIEHHDDKRVKTDGRGNVQGVDLVTLVSTADDLDAVGLVGVFRYVEIYALRGVAEMDLPNRVIENLRNRQANFIKHFSYLKDLSEHQQKRYSVALSFFEKLQQEQKADGKQQGDYMQIIRLLIDGLINQQGGIDATIHQGISLASNPYIVAYFQGLRDELVVFKTP